MKILLITEQPDGIAARMLQAGVANYNSSTLSGQALEIDMISPDRLLFERYGEQGLHSVHLVVVHEDARSLMQDGVWAPCRSLTVAHTLGTQNGDQRVFIVPPRETFSAIETVAALLGGSSGIVEERALIVPETIHEIISHQPSRNRKRNLLAIGYPATKLDAAKRLIEEWGSDTDSDDERDQLCWRTTVALAQLPKLEPILTGNPRPYSYAQLAKALNQRSSQTGFSLSEDDLRKVLKTLTVRLIGDERESPERTRLPQYARQAGFPTRPPVLPGISGDELAKRTYALLHQGSLSYRQMINDMAPIVFEVRDADFSKHSSVPGKSRRR